MKQFTQRVKLIEEMLRDENVICMIAAKTPEGIQWNGELYPDEDSLGEALNVICGDNYPKPLVIIDKSGERETGTAKQPDVSHDADEAHGPA